jgi:carbonic anhydrase
MNLHTYITLFYQLKRPHFRHIRSQIESKNMIYVQDNMSLGQLPKRLVIGCVDSDALNGTITKNPFEFKHHPVLV